MTEKSFLILGTGFITQNLVDYILNSNGGNKVTILYNKHTLKARPRLLQKPFMGTEIGPLLSDIQPHYIICTQGLSFVSENTGIIDSLHINTLQPMIFLEKIYRERDRLKNIEKILIVGSASEYGKFYEEPINENYTPHPTSIYGLTKILLNNVSMYYSEKNLPLLHIRQFNTTGPGQRKNFVVPSICRQIARIEAGKQKGIHIGDTRQKRDFIDVRDTALAYLLLLKNGNPGEIYNVASGTCYSIEHILNRALKLSNLSGNGLEIFKNKKLFYKEERLSNKLWADVSKIRSLGFTPKYSINDTLKDTLSYWRENDSTK